MNKVVEQIEWAGNALILETGHIAKQADGAVLVRYGKTTVLCTCVYAKEQSEETGFFPLTINYQERFYAAGRLPGGFVKREGKPSEHETLVSRLIDRPIRPLFPNGFSNEVQVICTLLSYDKNCSPEIASIIGASACISISGVPFECPIAGCKVGYTRENGYILNPTEKTLMDLTVAGSKDGILMVESQINELPEDVVLDGVMFGFNAIQPVIAVINKLKKKAGKPVVHVTPLSEKYPELMDKIRELSQNGIVNALSIKQKQERQSAIGALRNSVVEQIGSDNKQTVETLFEQYLSQLMRQKVLETKTRIDGRTATQIRPITCEIDVIPNVHGSALFTRGETQALAVTTLGSLSDVQIVDDVAGENKENFLLHYNFLPFSVGEIGRLSAPGRREIGHGKLAWRALSAVMPSQTEFPYTVRVVSEITESNGSSSMATVCCGSLSLMASGVPIKSPVAGIAMGLIKTNDDYVILSDIMGDEDHLGDMDFKVAGTDKGITALQMDIKITGITKEILKDALTQAHDGRMHILKLITDTIQAPRNEVSENAPRVSVITINKDKIRDLIGAGGKTIKDLCDRYNAKIEISDDGAVTVCTPDKSSLNDVLSEIELICNLPKIGQKFLGTVTRIAEFGAIVSIGSRDGMLHVSKLNLKKGQPVFEVLSIGQKVPVEVVEIDQKERMKFKLSK